MARRAEREMKIKINIKTENEKQNRMCGESKMCFLCVLLYKIMNIPYTRSMIKTKQICLFISSNQGGVSSGHLEKPQQNHKRKIKIDLTPTYKTRGFRQEGRGGKRAPLSIYIIVIQNRRKRLMDINRTCRRWAYARSSHNASTSPSSRSPSTPRGLPATQPAT